jgi:hypothetical protein
MIVNFCFFGYLSNFELFFSFESSQLRGFATLSHPHFCALNLY